MTSGNDAAAHMPLRDVRVVDLSWGIAGPVAAMLLADLGAEVIRVVDPARADREEAADPWWHRNKTIVSRPLESDGIRRLVAGADVLVSTDLASLIDVGAFADADATTDAERLVHLHVPHVTTRDDLDPHTRNAMSEAMWGLARRQNSFSGHPVDHVYAHPAYLQGTWAASAAIAALVERERSGLGQRVTVDDVHGSLIMAAATLAVDPDGEPAPTDTGPGGTDPLYASYRCGDGRWLYLSAVGPKFQLAALKALQLERLLEDPRVERRLDALSSAGNRGWARDQVATTFLTRPRKEWLDILAAHDCPSGPVNDRAEWLDHPQVEALGQRVVIDDPRYGESVIPGPPLHFDSRPAPPIAPRRFREDARWRERPAHEGSPAGGSGNGPLEGIRVLDTGTVLAGPFLGMLLASLGADVVKVEAPAGEADRVRRHQINRGKRSLAVDLRAPGAYAAVRAVIATTDVLIDNYRPGVAERLRLDRASLADVRPDLIRASITGFGVVGPLANRPGYDPVLQAMSGMMTAQGGPGNHPVQLSFGINDLGAACIASVGIGAALYARERGDGGDHVRTTLVHTATHLQGGELVRFEGRPPAAVGGPDYVGPSPSSRFYETRDGFVRVALPESVQPADLGVAVGYRLSDEEAAIAYGLAFGVRSTDEAVELVTNAGGTAVPARSYLDVAEDAEAKAVGYVGSIVWPDGGETILPSSNAMFSRTPRTPLSAAPGLGEHSEQVLREAGVDERAIRELADAGQIVSGTRIESVANIRAL